jgi:hypothetical protein
VFGTQAAFSSTGSVALGFGVQNIDSPASSVAFAANGASARRIGRPRQLQGAQQTLALGYDGSRLTLLVGSSPKGLACCSSVAAVQSAPKGFGAPRTLVRNLSGATVAHLVALPGRMLGAVATERGVWVMQTGADGHFAPARRLTGDRVLPEALDLTVLAPSRSIVAWAAPTVAKPQAPGATTEAGARSIFTATGSTGGSPRGGRAVITVAADHWIDEVALAGGARVPTLAWTESWFDTLGAYHTQVEVEDLGKRARPLVLSPGAELASSIAFSSDSNGEQALTWKGCTPAGTCVLDAALRRARGRFSTPQQLGPTDASQAPASAVSPNGTALVGWIRDGHVLAAVAGRRASSFGHTHLVSPTGFAADLALTFGSQNQALTTWTQGTFAQSVMGAVYQAR